MSGKNAVPESVIILSRMYAGSYLKDKIGHEVINMFRADNGKNYVYISEGETHDNSNFRIMKSRFIAAIRRVKELQTC